MGEPTDPRPDRHPNDSKEVPKYPDPPPESKPFDAPGGVGTGTKDDPARPDNKR